MANFANALKRDLAELTQRKREKRFRELQRTAASEGKSVVQLLLSCETPRFQD
jgi:hypothetical protein